MILLNLSQKEPVITHNHVEIAATAYLLNKGEPTSSRQGFCLMGITQGRKLLVYSKFSYSLLHTPSHDDQFYHDGQHKPHVGIDENACDKAIDLIFLSVSLFLGLFVKAELR
jgi:hypothetical protein